MIKWLIEDKKIKYILGCLFMTTIHTSAIILVILLVTKKIDKRFLYVCLFGAVAIGSFLYFIPTEMLSFINIGTIQYYLNDRSISYLGLAERIVMFIIITQIYNSISKQTEYSDKMTLLYKIYFMGFIIAIICFPWGMLSSRLTMMFKSVEVLIIPMFLKESKIYRQILLAFFVCYASIMTVKNIDAYIKQGGYQGYNVLTFPYTSILDKNYAHQVTGHNGYFKLLLNADIIDE